jgi:hypothetical protein
MKRPITFAVVPNAAFPDCEPARVLASLLDAGMLRRFSRKYGMRLGDCHEIAQALIRDLADCHGAPRFKWFWYVGDCPQIGDHSWIECEGWAIDASCGCDRPVHIQRADDYRRFIAASNIAQATEKPTPVEK